ncbi:MAG TPA: hypothetical protein VMU51_25750 [Mycobacteriales bacterium]|nr:hypothetical protein [Mycobacteriales bacterium]
MDPLGPIAIWCPLEPAIHADWLGWEENAVEWMERFNLDSEQLESGRLLCFAAGELAGRTTLRPPDAAGGYLAADSLLWMSAFDDAYCDEGRLNHNPAELSILVAEMIRVAETGWSGSASPCARALADLRQRVDRRASPVQASRWALGWRNYLSSQVWEAAYRDLGRLPSLDEYAVARIRTGGVEAAAMWLDIAGGYEVPAAEMERPDVRALTEIASTMVGTDNDLASYPKERERSACRLNIVDVIAHERQLPTAEALRAALVYRDAVLALYLALVDQVEPQVSEATRHYISGLSAWIRGNLDWSTHTDRYRMGGQQTVRVVHTPYLDPTGFTPPPGIAWWWAQVWPDRIDSTIHPSAAVEAA